MATQPTYDELIQTIKVLKKEVSDCKRIAAMALKSTELTSVNQRLLDEIDERQKIENALRESEARYRGLFENAPTSLWEEDLSRVKIYIENLRRKGILNFKEYFSNHPEAVANCASLVKVVAVNQMTLDLYRAKSKEELIAGLDQILSADCNSDFITQLVALADGATRFEDEVVNRTLEGDKMHLMLRWFAAPGFERTYSRVFLSFSDITEKVLTVEALKESEAKFRTLTENSPNMIFINNQGKVVYTNKRCEEIMGYTKNEFYDPDFDFLTLIAPECTDLVKSNFRKHMDGENLEPYEYTIVNKEGHKIEALITTNLIDYEGEKAILGIVTNISKQKRVERALEESRRDWENIFQAISHPTLILNPQHRVIAANRTAVQKTGISNNDLKDMHCYEVFHESRIPNKICPMERIVKSGRPRTLEMELKALGGTFLVTCTPIIDNNGQLEKVIHIATDITQRKQAEEALQASESKFRSFFDLSPQSVARIDFESGQMVEVNQKFCELFGFDKNEISGRSMLELGLCSEEQIHVFLDVLNRTSRVDGLEMNLKAKDGSILTTLVFARLIPINDDNFILVIFNDITKRKRLEQQLQQAHRMEALGTLAGGIAHDFNNLLMGILGNASLILSDMELHNPYREQLNNIESYVHSAAELTKQLLGFARGGKYEVKPTNLNELIERSASMFGRTKKEIHIHQKLQKDIWTVAIDQGQIDQVLLNLYVNAWQAMAGGGHLYIQTQNITLNHDNANRYNLGAGRYVKISITDTGIGMDDVTQQRIFEPFFTTQAMGRGTGLGLASAYGIIKNHGGTIHVYSEKGKGATFYIHLPVCEEDITPNKNSDREILMGQETILIVDDEKMIIEIGKKMLTKMGYRPMIAISGQEAIEVYRENLESIDLIILDMIMPDMNGQEAFDNLKKLNPAVKVLLSSGYSLNEQAQRIMESGCYGFIQKPFDAVKLSQKIRKIIDARKIHPKF